MCNSFEISANAQANTRTSNPIIINFTPPYQASNVSSIVNKRCPIDNTAAENALSNVECINAENVSELPKISLIVSPWPDVKIK